MDAGLVGSRILCLVAHVPDDDPAGTIPAFETWARRALQPVTVISIGSVHGAWELESRLAELRYTRIDHHDAIAAAEHGAELRQTLPQVVSAHAWLATRVAGLLECRDREFIWMLCIALSNPRTRTVGGWAQLLEPPDRRTLQRYCRAAGVPRPHEILDRLRLARAVVMAEELGATRGTSSSVAGRPWACLSLLRKRDRRSRSTHLCRGYVTSSDALTGRTCWCTEIHISRVHGLQSRAGRIIISGS
ncbi:MAG: hypothetical protein ACRELC_02510 [Gemmatimonadota bacterium]